MAIAEMREELLQDRERVVAGNSVDVVDVIDRALKHIEPHNLLTTSEAANLLGVRSVNTVKLWCRSGYLNGVMRGNRTMIPISEIERVQNADQVRAIRASDALHSASADLGVERGLDEEQLQDLAASRPGRLPWRGRSTGQRVTAVASGS